MTLTGDLSIHLSWDLSTLLGPAPFFLFPRPFPFHTSRLCAAVAMLAGDIPTPASLLMGQAVPATVASATAIPTLLNHSHEPTFSYTPEKSMQDLASEPTSIAPLASDRLLHAQTEDITAQKMASGQSFPQYEGLPERYELVAMLGNGTFSTVYRAYDRKTNTPVAIKVVRVGDKEQNRALNPNIREHDRSTERASILQEVQIMRRLRHENIVQLLDFIDADEYCYLVMEIVNGGELFDQIIKLTYMSEPLARHVICQVAEGIRFMHNECGIVHRDIKPENLLFEHIDTEPSESFQRKPYDEETKIDEGKFVPGVGGGEIGRVKIADFGLSKIVWEHSTKTPCGTVGYAAPEIVRNEQYSLSVDMWALGCVLYTLLCGFPPFYDESIKDLSEKVSNGHYAFLSPWWDDISVGAKDLVAKLLCVDVDARMTISEFFEHPWVKSGSESTNGAGAPVQQQTRKRMWPLSNMESVDSPLLASLHGNDGYQEGISTPVSKNHLREAFDVSFAVHRIEEEMRQSKRYRSLQPPTGTGVNSTAHDVASADARYGSLAAKIILDKHNSHAKQKAPSFPTAPTNQDDFRLSMDGATILQRRKHMRKPPNSEFEKPDHMPVCLGA